MNKLRTGAWKLSDLASIKKNGRTVFSCFHCGGGSTMGYKLAGFDVLGGVEIDPEMMAIYRANHHPKHSYLMGVQQFKSLPDTDLPKELFDLDILDGSPPCSSFSSIGLRHKTWGDKKKFREGQAEQILDDLFFDFIAIAAKLRPKIVVAENVKGLIAGKARGYVKEIFSAFKSSGYEVQLFLMNASRMGVPQARERTFFIARRPCFEKINLGFHERIIPAIEVAPALKGMRLITAGNERHYAFGRYKSPWNPMIHPAPTQTATGNSIDAARAFPGNGTLLQPIRFTDQQKILFQSFPDDFKFLTAKVGYVCGMSVPPFMMQRIADQIYKQWLADDTDKGRLPLKEASAISVPASGIASNG